MHPICLCFSTGRSGTTFLAHTLTATYHPEVDVFHEDISEFQSKPRCYLWSLDERDFAPMRKNLIIAAHLARVQQRSALRPYVDVGHTVTPLVSLLLATFPGRLRLLHLVRDPVEASASMAVRGMYHRIANTWTSATTPRATRAWKGQLTICRRILVKHAAPIPSTPADGRS